MTCGVVRDALRHWSGEVGFELHVIGPMPQHQVLGGVVGMGRDERSVVSTDVVDVVLFEHVAARRLGHDDVTVPAQRSGQCLHVALGNFGDCLLYTSDAADE